MCSNLPQYFLLSYIQRFTRLLFCHLIIRKDTDQHTLAILWSSSYSPKYLDHILKCGRPPRRCNLEDNRQRISTPTTHFFFFLMNLYFQKQASWEVRVLCILLEEQERRQQKTELTISLFSALLLSHLQNDTSQRDGANFQIWTPQPTIHTHTWKASSLFLPTQQDEVC